ncbi:MAG: hypothetical protein AAGF07_02945 [Patescibacteria group bacterium]
MSTTKIYTLSKLGKESNYHRKTWRHYLKNGKGRKHIQVIKNTDNIFEFSLKTPLDKIERELKKEISLARIKAVTIANERRKQKKVDTL